VKSTARTVENTIHLLKLLMLSTNPSGVINYLRMFTVNVYVFGSNSKN
jgi:hypothetical protein